MKVTYTSTYKMSEGHLNKLHKLIIEAIQSIGNVKFARIELDRQKGLNSSYSITSFLLIGNEIISIHSEGETQIEVIQFFYKEVYRYKETGLMRIYANKKSASAA